MTLLTGQGLIRTSSLPMTIAVVVLLAVGSAIAASSVAVASNHVETVVVFDLSVGELPEGVTVDKRGNVFVSLSPLGQLVKVEPGSNSAQLFGSVQGLIPGGIGLIGLATDAPGNV